MRNIWKIVLALGFDVFVSITYDIKWGALLGLIMAIFLFMPIQNSEARNENGG